MRQRRYVQRYEMPDPFTRAKTRREIAWRSGELCLFLYKRSGPRSAHEWITARIHSVAGTNVKVSFTAPGGDYIETKTLRGTKEVQARLRPCI